MIQVIIPTYNRALCIQYLLEESIKPYRGSLFEFLILDSSTDCETQKLINEFDKFNNVVYQRIPPVTQPDDKVISAIMRCKDDYYWLFGDGNLADFNKIEEILENQNYKEYDVLEIDNAKSKRNPDKNKELFLKRENLVSYIASNFTYLTYWGSSIIRTEKAKSLFRSRIMDKYRQDVLSWWSACLICEMINLEENNSVAIGTLYTDFLFRNPGKKNRSWAKGEKYFLTTFEVFNRDVGMLPNLFLSVKKDIIKNFRDDCLVTKRYLVELKVGNVLKLEYVQKYKRDIQIIKGYYPFMLFLSITPNFLIPGMRRLYKLGRRILK